MELVENERPLLNKLSSIFLFNEDAYLVPKLMKLSLNRWGTYSIPTGYLFKYNEDPYSIPTGYYKMGQ